MLEILLFFQLALGGEKPLSFGVISTESTTQLKKSWQPFLTEMEKSLGRPVRAFFASDYAGVIEALRFRKVDVAWLGNKAAMEAVDRADAEVFAQTVDADGNPGYWSLILVHKDSPIQNLDDLLKCDRKLNFGIGDPNSTSGFLVPMAYVFGKRDVRPKKCFKTVRGSNHQANALAVANKQVHAATNNTENYRRLKLTNPKAYEKIRILWKSPLIPADPLVWRKSLADDTKAKIKTFILGFGQQGDKAQKIRESEILKELMWAPFRPSDDRQLDPIRLLAIQKDLQNLETRASEGKPVDPKKIQALKEKRAAVQRRVESKK